MSKTKELWSYGEEAYEIMKKYLDIRLSMKDYISTIMDEASENGAALPVSLWDTAEECVMNIDNAGFEESGEEVCCCQGR